MTAVLAYWRRHFLGVEAALAVAPALALLAWFVLGEGRECVDGLMSDVRGDVYRTTATISGTLLGFLIAVASLVLGFVSTERLTLLQTSQHYPAMWETFFQTTRVLGALTVTALVCLVFDKDGASLPWLVVPFVLFLSLSLVRLLRVIWILERIIGIVSRPSPTSPLESVR